MKELNVFSKIFHFSFFVVFGIILCLSWSSQVHGTVLSSSQIEKCVNENTDQGLRCSEKLVVTMTLNQARNIQTETMDFNIKCLYDSGTGPCPCNCSIATDPNCFCRELMAPMKVSLVKSPVSASYSLQYLQSFNWKPYEITIVPSNKKCGAGDNEGSPTCGWYMQGSRRVPDSQGFCCRCKGGDVMDDTFKGNRQTNRGNLDCRFRIGMLFGFSYPVSAHCLKLDPQYFSGYQIGTAITQFSINVTVEIPQVGPPAPAPVSPPPPPPDDEVNTNNFVFPRRPPPQITYRTEVLRLSPSVPEAVSTGRMLHVRLLGDLVGYSSMPDLNNRILVMPEDSNPNDANLEGRTANRSTWMVLDRSMFSFDGSACDKVGTSFTAFRYQQNSCIRPQQTCLGNQLRDIWEADRNRRPPLYLLSQWEEGLGSQIRSNSGPLSFNLPVTSRRESLVTLTVVADSLRLVTNRSPGTVSNIRVCSFGNVTDCIGFEAGSRGYIRLNVTNIGRIPAEYTIVVTNCSENVRPIEARTLTLEAGQTVDLSPPIELYVEDDDELNRQCQVALYDSQGEITDSTNLTFFTNRTKYDEKVTGGYKGTITGGGDFTNGTECNTACSNALDVFCFLSKRCWIKLGKVFGIFGGLITGVGLLAIAAKFGFLSSMFGCCNGGGGSGCCGGGGGGGGGSCCGGSRPYGAPYYDQPPPPPKPNPHMYQDKMYAPGYPTMGYPYQSQHDMYGPGGSSPQYTPPGGKGSQYSPLTDKIMKRNKEYSMHGKGGGGPGPSNYKQVMNNPYYSRGKGF